MPSIGAIDLYRVKTPKDIPLLPWKGNHAQDSMLIAIVDAYIVNPATRIQEKKKAIRLLDIHAYGDPDPGEISDMEVHHYLKELTNGSL